MATEKIALRVECGPDEKSLELISVNSDITSPTHISTPLFEGYIVVRILSFQGDHGKKEPESGYFEKHPSFTWSIQFEGRFKEEINGDDLVFGNTFDHPIKDNLPWVTPAALQFIKYIDPPFEQDLYSERPWAWSPLLATMNYINLTSSPVSDTLPKWTSKQVQEDATCLIPTKSDQQQSLKENPSGRRKYFAQKENRLDAIIKPEHIVSCDFCNASVQLSIYSFGLLIGLLNFNKLSLKLPLSVLGEHELNLSKYWDGQPVRYVCRTRDGTKTFFVVSFNIVKT